MFYIYSTEGREELVSLLSGGNMISSILAEGRTSRPMTDRDRLEEVAG